MSRIRLKKYLYGGIQFVSIVDENDCPLDVYAAAYINSVLSRKAFNTTVRYSNELLFALCYFTNRSIDLTARVANGRLVSYPEYLSFFDFCHHQKSAPLEPNVIPFLGVEDKHLRNAMTANLRAFSKVSPETIQGRVRRLRQYLEWLFDEFHGGKVVTDEVEDRFHKLISKLKLDEQSFGRNSDFNPVSTTDSVIPDSVFESLQEMILPESKHNPFKSSKVRNYLIVSLLEQTGIRRGALAKIKISDCRFHGSYDRISIYRSRGADVTDPRLEKPNQKTRSHEAIVNRSLMEQIKFYIDHIRPQFNQCNTHDFIFVSEKNSKGTAGLPISLKTINNIFNKLSNSLNFQVHPHLLRHKWNEKFDAAGEEQNVERPLLEDMRRNAMGWSPNSTMGQTYNDKAIQRHTVEMMRKHQELVEQKNEGK